MPWYGWLTIGILIGPWVWVGAFWLFTATIDWMMEGR
jgi:hypothetical protein